MTFLTINSRRVLSSLLVVFAGAVGDTLAVAAQNDVAEKPAFPRESAKAVSLVGGGQPATAPEPRVLAWDVTWQKGQVTPLLAHPLDEVVVTLDDGAVRLTMPDGHSRIEFSRHGDVRFLPKGRVESEEGISDTPRRAIVVQLQDNLPPLVDLPKIPGVPSQFPRRGANKLFGTDRFIIWDQVLNWPEGQHAEFHAHYHPSVEINIEPGRTLGFNREGQLTGSPDGILWTPGRVTYGSGRPPHSEGSIGQPPRFIFIELLK